MAIQIQSWIIYRTSIIAWRQKPSNISIKEPNQTRNWINFSIQFIFYFRLVIITFSFETWHLQISERLLVLKCFAECISNYIFPVDMGMAWSLSQLFWMSWLWFLLFTNPHWMFYLWTVWVRNRLLLPWKFAAYYC